MDNPLFVLTITRSWNNDTDVGVSVRESPDDNISITRVFCDGIIALDGDFFAVPAKEALQDWGLACDQCWYQADLSSRAEGRS